VIFRGMLLGVVASLTFATGAGATTGYVQLGRLDVSPTTGPAGTVVTVSGDNCSDASSRGSITGGGDSFFAVIYFEAGDQSVDAPATGGSWTQDLTVPGDTAVGTYAIKALCFVQCDSSIDGVGFESRAELNKDEGGECCGETVGKYKTGQFTVTEPATTTTEPATTTTEPATTTTEPATTTTTEVSVTTLGTVPETTTTTVPETTTTTGSAQTALAAETTAASGAAELPRTGADPTALLTVGTVSILSGLGALGARRRSRKHSS